MKEIIPLRNSIKDFWENALSNYPNIEILLHPKERGKGRTPPDKPVFKTHDIPPQNILSQAKNSPILVAPDFRYYHHMLDQMNPHDRFLCYSFGVRLYNEENDEESQVTYFFIIDRTGNTYFKSYKNSQRTNQWSQLSQSMGYLNDPQDQMRLVEKVKEELGIGITKKDIKVITNLKPRFDDLEKR